MKLINVTFIEESSRAAFFEIEHETNPLFGSPKRIIRYAVFNKSDYLPMLRDNGDYLHGDALKETLILEYEKKTKTKWRVI